MAAPSRFCHIVYRTNRYDDMVRWYQVALEARIQVANEKVAFLTYDDEHHRMAIRNLGGMSGDQDSHRNVGVGIAHVAYAWPTLEELIDTYYRMKRFGVLPIRSTRHGVTVSFYYEDPDRNQVEFQLDLLDTDAASEYMRTEAFIANTSERFDTEELLRRYEAGEPVDSLIYRIEQPQRLGSRYIKGNDQQPWSSSSNAGISTVGASA